MSIDNYALREVSDLTFIDVETGIPFLYMDYAIASSNEFTSETTYARGGKGNPKRQGFDGNKESTLQISTQVFTWKFISLISGAEVETGATNVFKREVLKSEGTSEITITLSETPITDTITVFPLASDGIADEKETITVSDKVVTITNGTADTDYVAYYQFLSDTNAEKISFKSNVFPSTCKIIGDTLIKNSNGVNEPFQMIAYLAKPRSTFTLTQSSDGDPSTLEITFDLLSDSQNRMIDYIHY